MTDFINYGFLKNFILQTATFPKKMNGIIEGDFSDCQEGGEKHEKQDTGHGL